MSLRFERKGSLRKKRDRSDETNSSLASRDRQYFMSWSYRQCQFACDYLNLMEDGDGSKSKLVAGPGNLAPVDEGIVSGISRARFGSFRVPPKTGTTAGGMNLNQPRMRSSIATCSSSSSRASFSGSSVSSRTSGYAESIVSSGSASSRGSSYGFDFERVRTVSKPLHFYFSLA